MKNKRLLWGLVVAGSLVVTLWCGRPLLGTDILLVLRSLLLVGFGYMVTGSKRLATRQIPTAILGYILLVGWELFYPQFREIPTEIMWLMKQRVIDLGYILVGVSLC